MADPKAQATSGLDDQRRRVGLNLLRIRRGYSEDRDRLTRRWHEAQSYQEQRNVEDRLQRLNRSQGEQEAYIIAALDRLLSMEVRGDGVWWLTAVQPDVLSIRRDLFMEKLANDGSANSPAAGHFQEAATDPRESAAPPKSTA